MAVALERLAPLGSAGSAPSMQAVPLVGVVVDEQAIAFETRIT
jgi:hypothetical protein